ncbi:MULTISPECIES: FtsK/SpoIIIE domain-containing protein [unclassified Streptomyces]|uniref:FtsK/SpoIIIE domain-containing protein n=1 Tax=unclassified Streptomyces TaxID=2593676 RepID=UPI00224FB16D|nr:MULTISPECIES: FtsK/SpoIIIE domain-containing protein [unclassified Streptomyces]MCX4526115.1 FtsK/SpoIIIE domain-containing protein [Streptomyces sp. NBC_01551]MCX4543320.1 FtsK/SpoIIIE domain-containing protein [Streptomyces sp. NBC_01565]
MQIRLTVLGSRSGHQTATSPTSCDVLVTAPAGTALAAVASGLAATVGGPDTGGTVVLYAGAERLDPQRRVLGEPPLVDGAVLALHGPVPDVLPDAEEGLGAPQLHVVAGPDAGGVHLLHPGSVRIGRSADADVPLDDPDVSRAHCAVTVMPDGRVAVADLNSTNGTTLDGVAVGERAVAVAPGALLRVGESTLRLSAGAGAPLPVTPDQEGHLSIPPAASADDAAAGDNRPGPATADGSTGRGPGAGGPAVGAWPAAPGSAPGGPAGRGVAATGSGPQGLFPHPAPSRTGGSAPDPTPHPGAPGAGRPAAPGAAGTGRSGAPASAGAQGHRTPAPGQGGAPASAAAQGSGARQGGGAGSGAPRGHRAPGLEQGGAPRDPGYGGQQSGGPRPGAAGPEAERRRRRGIGAWARKWVRGEEGGEGAAGAVVVAARPDVDDPAALLLAALGPTRRLWSRPPGALDVGLGAGSRVALRDVGGLGIAGPRARLTGVARSVIAQLAGLHAPAQLEIVLISTDRVRALADRRRDWGWLGWLPHVRPAHGQDCRLLLAYDRDQAAARAGELTRRLDDSHLGAGWATADRDAVRQAAAAYEGPYTLVVLDGDPGTGALRDVTARLATHGPAVGIHLLCLADAPAATPASPVADTYETACASIPAFRDCGAAALLSGDVATTVRTFSVGGGKPLPPGETATADAVSAAWAERFARALAPLRADATHARPSRTVTAAALPQTARLLDELGLARATPASLMARWAAATDQGQDVGGLVEIVLGAGRRGPVGAELVHDGPHLLIEGPAGSGRTELLRSVAASLAAAARPDRLGLVLLDGAGGERGDGLQPCTDLPHVATHLVASDPVRMREFAQALGAELKRRAELLDGVPFTEWHARHEVGDRMVAPRRPTPGELRGDLEPQRTGTLRLRASAIRTDPPAGPSPLPRLVVLVDDLDALVAPGLGSMGRPAAGSVVRALEAVARDGARLGVHLVATSARPDRTADTELARLTALRVELDAPDQPGPGRGRLRHADGTAVPFQGGRVTGRIPRTATLRPTVVPVEWERMGDPPARRPVRELGNGPTDLALLASALDRASHLVSAIPVLFPPAP